MLDIRDFGAVGDGITNDTVNIQEALDNGAETGQSVYVPKGIFLANTLWLRSLASLAGDGYGSVLKLAPATDAPLLANESAAGGNEHIGIGRLRLDGNAENQTQVPAPYGSGIRLVHTSDVRIADLWIENCIRDGAYLGGAPGIYYESRYGNEEAGGPNIGMRVKDCEIRSNQRHCLTLGWAEDVWIQRNAIAAPGLMGIDVEPNAGTPFVRRIWINDNVIRDCPQSGLSIGGGAESYEDFFVSGNVFLDDVNSLEIGAPIHGFAIESNIFRRATGTAGIRIIAGVNDGVIANNVVKSNAAVSIQIIYGNDIVVAGNRTTQGIQVGNLTTAIVQSGNLEC